MSTEAAILRSIMAYLKERPDVFAFKIHGSPMQVAGLPDVVGVMAGQFFGLEVKRPGMKVTPLQEAVLRKIRAMGGIAEVVTSVQEVEATLLSPPPREPEPMSEPAPVVIVFSGHRDCYVDPALLPALDEEFPGALWRHGGAKEGFDAQVQRFAVQEDGFWQVYRPRYRPVPPPDSPDWVLKVGSVNLSYLPWPKVAPLKRNEELLDGREGEAPAGLLIACYDGRRAGGTFYTVQYADLCGVPFRVWEPQR